ncbi:tRNA 2-thiouridine(34) synthase MnmA [Candidatus Gracilibacteria bacterium]|nr:tRNA 2-thiouridine(34) synthase MnmA [Candidatus Gracilibacteria bacterium]
MKIAVLLSGGVDSSVALKLLQDQGHDVTAFYLKIWLEDELAFLGSCPWEEDLKYVQEICTTSQIPLEIIPMQKEYFDTVVAYTIQEVKEGRTPNPDIMCNNHVKFGLFFDKISEGNFDKIASGHYAQTYEKDGIHYLKQAPDPVKDQTYFLSRLSQKQLAKIIFPIGHLPKEEVRKLAEQYDLPNKSRKDSQGICFLGKFKYNEFLEHYLGERKGDLIEEGTGKKWGEHKGFWFHTVGQRKGINLSHGPWYVVRKDCAKNIVYISTHYHEKTRDTLQVTNLNWFAGHPPEKSQLKLKLRHGPEFHQAQCDFSTNTIKLAASDQGIASGQFAVFYDGDICLGSGMIV